MRTQGVACSAAARLKRRAGVSAASLTAPMTSARLADLKPSSMAQSASVARAVSTKRQEEAVAPKAEKPCAQGCPMSRASTDGQHHRMRGRVFTGVAPSASKRRTARRRAKPSAAAQPPAMAPAKPASGFTSCRVPALRPPARRWSISGAPSVHALALGHCGSERSGRTYAGARCSSAAMRARKPAMRGSRAPSGTARRDSPFRFGQEGQSPTLGKLELERGPGSGREIRCRRAVGGMGDGAAWSTGTLSQQLSRQRCSGPLRSIFVLFSFAPQVKPKRETKRDHMFLKLSVARFLAARSRAAARRKRPARKKAASCIAAR